MKNLVKTAEIYIVAQDVVNNGASFTAQHAKPRDAEIVAPSFLEGLVDTKGFSKKYASKVTQKLTIKDGVIEFEGAMFDGDCGFEMDKVKSEIGDLDAFLSVFDLNEDLTPIL